MRRLNRWLDSLGAAGVVGLGILASCAFFYFSAVAPALRELESQQSAVERSGSRSPYRAVSTDPRTERLLAFHGLFPPVDTLSDELERLYALARAARLELRQAEYRLEGRETELAAYRITLPVRGTYGEMRDFLSAVLAAMPIASIDGLRFERKKASEAQLEAQLRLTLYFRTRGADGQH